MKTSSRGSGRHEAQLGARGGRSALRGLVVLAVLGAVTGAAGLGAHAWKKDVVVRGVRVEGNRLVPEEEILARVAIPRGSRLFAVNLSSVRRRVMALPYVVSVDVERDVNRGLIIRVKERKPVAAIPGDHLLYVDATGLVLPGLPSDRKPDVPLLTGAIPAHQALPGRRITSVPVRAALALLDTASLAGEDLDRLISEVRVQPDGGLVLYSADGAIPVLIGTGAVADKLAGLEVFWNSVVAGRGARELVYVDLRFDRQVVARWR